jgi:phage FluMu protein Com
MQNVDRREIRCFYCDKLLAKAHGTGILEIKCHRCKKYNLYLLKKGRDSIQQLLINKGDVKTQHLINNKKIIERR